MISKLLKFIYFLTPCICVLIGLEIILRFTNLSPYQVPVYPYDYFEKNDIYGYDIKKDQKRKKFSSDEYSFTVWGNEIGCFDYPINNLKDGYILLVGASVTWGFVPLKYNYGTVLENKLNNTRILKCGVPGFSLKQKFLKTNNIIKKLEKKPELIIFVYSFPTDLRGDYLFPQYKVENNILTTNKVISSFETGEIQLRKDSKKTLSKKIKYLLSQKSYLFRFSHLMQKNLRKKLKKKEKNESNENNKNLLDSFGPGYLSYFDENKMIWVKNIWKEHLQTLKDFKELAEKNDAGLLVIYWDDLPDYSASTLESLINNDSPITLDNNKKVFNFFEEENINYLNMTEKMFEHVGYTSILDKRKLLKGNLIYKKNNHPSIEGNNFMGNSIYFKICDYTKLKPKPLEGCMLLK